MTSYDVVIPTIGRTSLGRTLSAVARGDGPRPGTVYVVNDRPPGSIDHLIDVDLPVKVLQGPGRGPAAARNVGWRAGSGRWVVFLDDDVVPDHGWRHRLDADLRAADADVAGVQGRLRVPLPRHRRPTDWERNVHGLERARWVTADMAYRRSTLELVGGFDERFRRAYREDADLALRVLDAGWRLTVGERTTAHPVRPADAWVSVRLQAGNADDPLMWALHGRGWRRRAGAPRGRFPWHLATALSAVVTAGAAVRGRRRLAAAGLIGWAGLTSDLALRRIIPGPRTPADVSAMVATSAVLPFAATYHRLRGWARLPSVLRTRAAADLPDVVLLDRDGTIVVDEPYNGDPALVRPVAGAKHALDRLRAAGVRLAVVSNQSGVARGLITASHVEAVNARVEEVLGPFATWSWCPHGPDDGCACRKPATGLLAEAAATLGVPPHRCVLIGDTGADVDAATAFGARPILVPTQVTRPEEIAAAPEVAASLDDAVGRILAGRPKEVAR